MTAAADRLAAANRKLSRQVRARVLYLIRQAAGTFDTLSQAEIDRFVATVVPAVQPGQIQTANLTAIQLSAQLAALGIVTGRIRFDRDAALGHRGIPYTRVYARPGVTARAQLAAGKSKKEALTAALNRAYDIASADLQLARTHTARSVMTKHHGEHRYRRVLQGAENCYLCATASTQSYGSGDLMPIHPGCDCTVAPLPPGVTDRIIDPDRLAQLKEIAADEGIPYGDRTAMANHLIKVNAKSVDDVISRSHGELGPVLAVRRHRNKTADELPKWHRQSRREFAR